MCGVLRRRTGLVVGEYGISMVKLRFFVESGWQRGDGGDGKFLRFL